jgi:hypothetical protein
MIMLKWVSIGKISGAETAAYLAWCVEGGESAIFQSRQSDSRPSRFALRFVIPTVAKGRVYVGGVKFD